MNSIPQASAEQPLLVLKPKFIFSLFLLSLIAKEAFFAIWATMFLGIMGVFVMTFINVAFHLSFPLWLPALVAFLVAIIGVPIISYILSAQNYKNTEYRFYTNRLEYMDGFINLQMKSLEYQNITSVSIRKGFFQRMYNVGSLVLITPAVTMLSNTNLGSLAGAIVLVNIEDPEKIYQYIQDILSKGKQS
ncbi:MAG TPA: PH domain-containing protein [Candidatus Andersenbacteria bacterium]|nr:PH domain-containing protein [Candidatus Andersenbacteria bacterium]